MKDANGLSMISFWISVCDMEPRGFADDFVLLQFVFEPEIRTESNLIFPKLVVPCKPGEKALFLCSFPELQLNYCVILCKFMAIFSAFFVVIKTRALNLKQIGNSCRDPGTYICEARLRLGFPSEIYTLGVS